MSSTQPEEVVLSVFDEPQGNLTDEQVLEALQRMGRMLFGSRKQAVTVIAVIVVSMQLARWSLWRQQLREAKDSGDELARLELLLPRSVLGELIPTEFALAECRLEALKRAGGSSAERARILRDLRWRLLREALVLWLRKLGAEWATRLFGR